MPEQYMNYNNQSVLVIIFKLIVNLNVIRHNYIHAQMVFNQLNL